MNDPARVRRLSRVYEPSVASDGARVLVGAHDIEHNDVVALADYLAAN
jgi:uncharacterized protein YeaO (DUF488 family)